MLRNVSKFVLLALLGATLPAALLSAPPCYSQQAQQDQHNQPGQPPAQPATTPQQQQQQQPGTTPPRPTSTPNSGQDSSQESTSKKTLPPDDTVSTKTPPDVAKKSKPGVLPPEDDPAWDPFHAQQDIDVGTFYLHKGDVDAAIARFEDAINRRANFAKHGLEGSPKCVRRDVDPEPHLNHPRPFRPVADVVRHGFETPGWACSGGQG